MRYTTMHPNNVERIFLVAPAGFDEPWYRLSHTVPMLSKLSRRVPRRLGTKISLIQNTPRYKNVVDWFRMAAVKILILLICTTFD